MKIRLWFMLAMVVVLGGAIIYFWFQGGISPLSKKGEVNLLILGLDQVEGTSRSDTIVATKIQRSNVDAIFVPRDTRVKFPGGELGKINSSYLKGKVKLTKEIVSSLLDFPMQYYIIVDYQGFEKIIDILGGVTIDVEKDLDYEDQSQNLYIHIPKGRQHLSGREALNYARYRGELGDLGRIERQQKLIKTLLNKGIQFKGWDKLKELVKTAYQYMETNLSLADMYGVAKLLEGITVNQVRIERIPGTPVTIEGINYLEPDVVGTKELVNELIRDMDILTNSDIEVSVLNGNGVYRMAHRVGEYLKEKGFTVGHIGDADTYNYEQNHLLNLCEDERKLNKLKEALQADLRVIQPEAFSDHLGKIKRLTGYAPKSEDFVFIFGRGFNIGK